MDGVVGCDVAWTAVGLIACRLSDCCSWIALYLFRLDGIQSSSPYMVRLFCFHFGFALRYIYRRFGIIRILGIPVGRYASVLFLFFAQRAVASVSIWVVIGGIIAMVAYAAALYGIFHGVLLRKRVFERMKIPYRRLRVSGVLLLLTGLLFIPIRGGFTVSTMNTGKVYFSTDQRLNHAAINPAFSLMESLSKQKDFGSQYRFMEADTADRIFSGLADPAVPMRDGISADSLQQASDSLHSLFTTKRPDVLFIIMESFSSWLMTTLGGEPGVAVQLDSLAQEGVLFTNFYAKVSAPTEGWLPY